MNRLCCLFLIVIASTASAFAQPLLTWMEEGDQIHLRVWISGCFQMEDNIYRFEMKEGKISCTGHVLPDYVSPQRHPRVRTAPVELTKAQIEGINSDIVQFRTTPLRSQRKESTGLTIIKRSGESGSTTQSEITLTFIEKGKPTIEESIHSPSLHVLYHGQHKGLADLKRILQIQAESELNRIKVSEEVQKQQPAVEQTGP